MTDIHLRNFVAVAETGNFTQAAELNMTTQSAVSHSIKTLEEELGGKLLERSTRSVKLTKAGEWFLQEAKEILLRIDSAGKRVRAMTFEQKTLMVGYSGLIDSAALLDGINKFCSEYPDISIRLVKQDTSRMLIQSLLQNELDLAICFKIIPIPDDLHIKIIGKSLRYALLSPDHPLSGSEKLQYSDLANESLVGFEQLVKGNGTDSLLEISDGGLMLQFKTQMVVDDTESLAIMVAANSGIAMLPIADKEKFDKLKLIPIVDTETGEQEMVEQIIVWPAKNDNTLVRDFIACFEA